MDVSVGQRYRTPFEPAGVVEVLALEPVSAGTTRRMAVVRFIGDHPHGYPDGTEGRYFADNLRPLDDDGIPF
jgi:hypothetical protein